MCKEFIRNLNPDRIKKEAFAIHRKVGAFSTRWHRHRKHQLLYAEGGVLYFKTKQLTYVLPARFAAWIPSKSYHQIYSASPGLLLRVLYFEPEPEEGLFFQRLNVFSVSDLAREMILETESWRLSDKTDEIEATFFKAIKLLVQKWGEKPLPVTLPIPKHPRLREVTDHITRNLAEPLKVGTIAAAFGFSERTLMRLFQKELALPFTRYLKVARIIKALELLTKPGASVTETAFQVGYESLGSFSNMFQQIVGVRPSEYLNSKNREDEFH